MTFTRLVGGSLVLPFLLFYLLPKNLIGLNFGLAALFGLFSMTDFLDGYLARKYGLETPIGRALDPIADKFLVCSSLITLLALQKIYFWWVIILIGREMCMMSLRHFAALHNISISVSYLGKLKACFQMFLIAVMIARPVTSYGDLASGWLWIEQLLLAITLYYSLISFYRYAVKFAVAYRQLI